MSERMERRVERRDGLPGRVGAVDVFSIGTLNGEVGRLYRGRQWRVTVIEKTRQGRGKERRTW